MVQFKHTAISRLGTAYLALAGLALAAAAGLMFERAQGRPSVGAGSLPMNAALRARAEWSGALAWGTLLAAGGHGVWLGRRLRRGQVELLSGWPLGFIAGVGLAAVVLLTHGRGTAAAAYQSGLEATQAAIGVLGIAEALLAILAGARRRPTGAGRGLWVWAALTAAAAAWISAAVWLEFVPAP